MHGHHLLPEGRTRNVWAWGSSVHSKGCLVARRVVRWYLFSKCTKGTRREETISRQDQSTKEEEEKEERERGKGRGREGPLAILLNGPPRVEIHLIFDEAERQRLGKSGRSNRLHQRAQQSAAGGVPWALRAARGLALALQDAVVRGAAVPPTCHPPWAGPCCLCTGWRAGSLPRAFSSARVVSSDSCGCSR